MIFTPTPLNGAYIVEPEKREDERGFFARSWCQHEFEQHGLDARLVQCNISHNRRQGTLRGLHFQAPPFEEAKLVRCTRGVLFDVILDLRPASATYLRWTSLVLSAENYLALYVPAGFAHGFQTLTHDTEVFYQMSEFFAPEYARGVRWNDPLFQIAWPAAERVISPRDASFPDFVANGCAPLASPADFAGSQPAEAIDNRS